MNKFKVSLMFFLIIILFGNWSWAAVPRNGLVAEYLFEGNSTDTSGNGNNGTVNGATLTADRFGKVNRAYNFNGTNNYIDVGPLPALGNNPATLTECAWVSTSKSGGTGINYVILSKRHVNNSEWSTLELLNARGTLVVDDYGYANPIRGTSNINDNTWHFVCGTRNNSGYKIYVDGALEGQKTDTRAVSGSTYNMHIGHQGAWASYFNGKIDDVRIYNRALSAAEIVLLYQDSGPAISAFSATPTAGSAPLIVNFTCRATSKNATITQYKWDLNGDGIADQTTTTGHLSYTFAFSGTYNATVTVVDSNGASAESDPVKVTVGLGPELLGEVEYYEYDKTTNAINIQYRVYNTGSADAGAFNVNFIVSDNGKGATIFNAAKVDGIASLQDTLLDVSYTFPESIYGRQISIAIDSGRKVAEVDETNNGAKIIIGPTPTK
jgi:PKD repeat protein